MKIKMNEQVRSLLLEELGKDLSSGTVQGEASGGLAGKARNILQLLNKDETKTQDQESFRSSTIRVPFDYIEMERKVGNGSLEGIFRDIGHVRFATLFFLA